MNPTVHVGQRENWWLCNVKLQIWITLHQKHDKCSTEIVAYCLLVLKSADLKAVIKSVMDKMFQYVFPNHSQIALHWGLSILFCSNEKKKNKLWNSGMSGLMVTQSRFWFSEHYFKYEVWNGFLHILQEGQKAYTQQSPPNIPSKVWKLNSDSAL